MEPYPGAGHVLAIHLGQKKKVIVDPKSGDIGVLCTQPEGHRPASPLLIYGPTQVPYVSSTDPPFKVECVVHNQKKELVNVIFYGLF